MSHVSTNQIWVCKRFNEENSSRWGTVNENDCLWLSQARAKARNCTAGVAQSPPALSFFSVTFKPRGFGAAEEKIERA